MLKHCNKIGELGKQGTPTISWLDNQHLILADDFGCAEGISLVELLGSESARTQALSFPQASPILKADFVGCFDLVPLRDGRCTLVANFPDAEGNPLDQVFQISPGGIVAHAPPKQDSSIALVSELQDGRFVSLDGESEELRVTDVMLSEIQDSCPYPANPENEDAGMCGLSGWRSDHLIGAFADWPRIVILKWDLKSLREPPETVRVFEHVEQQGMCIDANMTQYALVLTDTKKDLCTLNVLRESNHWQVVECDRTGIPIDDRAPFFCGEDVLFFDHRGCLSSVSPTSDTPQFVHDFEQPVLTRAFQAATRQLAVLLQDGSLHLAQF